MNDPRCLLLAAFCCSVLTLQEVCAQPVNVALKKPVMASGVEAKGFEPEGAVDGVISSKSRWSSGSFNAQSPQWLVVDLQQETTIDGVTLDWEAAHALAYQIQVSSDAAPQKRWTTLFSTQACKGGRERIVLEKQGKGRFVRLLITEANKKVWHCVSVIEWGVYSGGLPEQTMEERLAEWRDRLQGELVVDAKARQLALPPPPGGVTLAIVGSDAPAVIDVTGKITSPLSTTVVNLCLKATLDGTPAAKPLMINLPVVIDAGKGPDLLPVIPAVQECRMTQGQLLLPSEITVQSSGGASDTVATLFLDDLHALTGHTAIRKSSKATIQLELSSSCRELGKEGYIMNVSEQGITLVGPERLGLYWGTRTLLQLMENNPKAIPCCTIRDYPRFAVRGLTIDVARKFFTLDFLKQYVKILSYYKMNELQVHLNDNGFKDFWGNWDDTYSAFRMESETYPGLTAKDGSYSKNEFRSFVKDAATRGVDIIPEFDAPAHSLAFVHYKPSLGSQKYGMDHLDLQSPELIPFMRGLWSEYLLGDDPVFAGPNVHVGTDEYSKAEAEAFRAYTDTMFKTIKAMGKNVRAWGALSHAQGKTPVDSAGVTLDIWNNPFHQPLQAIDEGFNIISVPDGIVYIVPAAGYYYDYLNIQGLYNNWTPAQIGNVTLPAAHPSLLGGHFAIWNDHVGNGISEHDAHDRLFPSTQTLAQKMWSGKVQGQTFDDFKQLMNQRSVDAPGVNLTARVNAGKEGVALRLFADKEETCKPGAYTATGVNAIGWSQAGGYTVSFDLRLNTPPAANTVLFFSDRAHFKLTQTGTGKLGFSRDGYDYSFDYSVPVGVWVNLMVVGDSQGTDLYVDGLLKESLRNRKYRFPKTGKEVRSIQTLVFPLGQVGGFDGSIRNLTARTGKTPQGNPGPAK